MVARNKFSDLVADAAAPDGILIKEEVALQWKTPIIALPRLSLQHPSSLARGYPKAVARLTLEPNGFVGSKLHEEACEFPVISGLRALGVPGRGDLVITGYGAAQNAALREAVQAALGWVRIHQDVIRSMLALQVAGATPTEAPLATDLNKPYLDVFVDFDHPALAAHDNSVGLATACSLVQLLTGVGVEGCVMLAGVVDLSGKIRGVGGIEAKLSVAANWSSKTRGDSDVPRLVVLPMDSLPQARDALDRHKGEDGWDNIRVLGVSHMADVIRLVFNRSVSNLPPGVTDGSLISPATLGWADQQLRQPQPTLLGVAPGICMLADDTCHLVEVEAAVLPGCGRVICTSASGVSDVAVREQAVKACKIARDMVLALREQNMYIRCDASGLDADLLLHVAGEVQTAHLGMAMVAALLGAALGRPIDPKMRLLGPVTCANTVGTMSGIVESDVRQLASQGVTKVLCGSSTAEDFEACKTALLQTGSLSKEERASVAALNVIGLPTRLNAQDMYQALWGTQWRIEKRREERTGEDERPAKKLKH